MNAVKFFLIAAVLVASIFAVSAADNQQNAREKRFPFWGGAYAYGAYPYSAGYGYGGLYGGYGGYGYGHYGYGAYPYGAALLHHY